MSNLDNVYKGAPDERQSTSVNHPVSRFRPTYRALTPEEKALHDALKEKAVELETLINSVKSGQSSRYKSMALTDLESSVMWAVKELTS